MMIATRRETIKKRK